MPRKKPPTSLPLNHGELQRRRERYVDELIEANKRQLDRGDRILAQLERRLAAWNERDKPTKGDV